jgi:hypothetical protein
MFGNRTEEAVGFFRTAARLHRAAGDEKWALDADISVLQVAIYGGGAATAVVELPALVQQARAIGNASTLSWAYYVLGEAFAATGDLSRAQAAYRSCVETGAPVDNRLHVMLARSSAVAVTAAHDSPGEAVTALERVLAEWEDIGGDMSQWWILQNLAILLVRLEAWTDAAPLMGAVLANLERFPAFVREVEGLREAVSTLERHLDTEERQLLMAEGSAFPISAAVAHARDAIRRAA